MLEGRAESTLSFGFYKVRDKGFPPFAKEKIDSGGILWHNFWYFYPYRSTGRFSLFFFFFFLDNITRITFTFGTDQSMYKAETENTC